LDSYDAGAFFYSGREPLEADLEWQSLSAKLMTKKIPKVSLVANDIVFLGKDRIEVLSPDPNVWQSGGLNETSLVLRLTSGAMRMLFAGDIDEMVENNLVGKKDLSADVLKVAHHGSKYSSAPNFLAEIDPLVSVISVGARNTYGHPASLVLERLKKNGSRVFRTDINGTVRISWAGNKLRVFTER
ncbi:MAG: hypothetical protein V1856_00985, partial [Candidatus Liptonbacteria bacterium]